MRLLKTHSHTCERPSYEARKNAKKVIEGNAETIKRQIIRQTLPRRYGKTNHRQNPPGNRRRGGGSETKKGKLKENTGAKTRETKSKPSRRLPSWRGGRDNRRNPTRNGKVAQPTVPRGEKVPSRKRISKEKTKQRASQRKEDKTDQLPISEVITGLPRPYHHTSPP